ncbi:transient receptor potential cation channel subfamily M member 2-like [Rhinatrema bivittatum]|uniref:transient receptor potential cation channel subfamily M member 2-like n=1 Tax=Rhinatrema bivittatum TaxID=194408 RepID=UPI00112AB8C1|nr:transient receptor potential cation channel subfamily M member 2-like [Rhinatrema bivittatum]
MVTLDVKVHPDEADGHRTPHPALSEIFHLPHSRPNTAAAGGRRKSHVQYTPMESEKVQILSSWVLENIKKKECVNFIQSLKPKDGRRHECGCGYYKEHHQQDIVALPSLLGELWDARKHIREVPTDAFGDFTFTGLGQKVCKYVRVSNDTSPKLLYQMLTQQWGLSIPSLLISVTGGAKNFNLKAHLKDVFSRGLVKAAQTTGAWIITGGTHAGVMKHVGEAVRDFSISSGYKDSEVVVIGITTWGVVHNRSSLISGAEGLPARYLLDVENQGHLCCLDINHSHFILVDDGTHGRYGVEISLRTKLEKFISEQTMQKGGVAIKIPIVCVVLEGGPGTLDTTHSAMTNNTPCVIVEDSGRVADVIAQVANLHISMITIALIKEKLRNLFQDTCDSFTENQIVEWTKKIQDIVRMNQLLTIFQADKDGDQDVDVAILQSLMKASRSLDHKGNENWDYQLKLAVAWNRVDIAKSDILTDEKLWKPLDLYPVVTVALIENKPDFVRLFLEKGVNLREFVTWETLIYLYNNIDPTSLIHSKLMKVLHDEKILSLQRPQIHLGHVSQVIKELLGEFTDLLYPTEQHHRALSVLHIKAKVEGVGPQAKFKGSEYRPMFNEYPIRDLLIWSVLQNRRELAEIIWAQSRDCIAGALACSKILKELSKEEDDTDNLEEMVVLADAYELRAIRVFSECYRKNEEKAEELLTRVSPAWGKTTCLQLAVAAQHMKFMSHGGVQAFLTKIWWGKLSVDNRMLPVLLCMLLFPLMFTGLISFRHERKQTEGTPKTRVKGFFTAPVVVFYCNVVSYVGFLWLFAYVLTMDFQASPVWQELLLYGWIFTLLCEELRQLLYDPNGMGFVNKSRMYILEFWNKVDVLTVILFLAGLTCRFFSSSFYAGKVMLSLDFIIFCLRLVHIFAVSRILGPKIIMLHRMVRNVIPSASTLCLLHHLDDTETRAILNWEAYMRENYLLNEECEQSQSTDQKIQDTSEKVSMMMSLLQMHQVKQSQLMEQRLAVLEEQVSKSTKALSWIVTALAEKGFRSKDDAAILELSKALEGSPAGLGDNLKDTRCPYHVNARNLQYPDSSIIRFPVPDEKVPWMVEFEVYNPPFYIAERADRGSAGPLHDACGTSPELTCRSSGGLIAGQSAAPAYLVKDGLPLNPMGRTGLRGIGSLRWYGPNRSLHAVLTRWKRNTNGMICRKDSKKMLEVLVIKHKSSEHWYLPGGTLGQGEKLPSKLKEILKREFWEEFQSLQAQGTRVFQGYLDDPRNTDNAWIETLAVNIHCESKEGLDILTSVRVFTFFYMEYITTVQTSA